jgi:ADP-ribosyl-[dinitrogen reductase] hydrolase
MSTQTSTTNPLRIDAVPFGSSGGLIGLTIAPGKQQRDGLSAVHRRDLDTDLDAVAAWSAAAVVTLVEVPKMDALGIAAIGAEVRRRHMEWHHWPIGDYQIPDAAFMADWPMRSAMLRSLLARGGRVLVHCKGGLGRSGSVAARLLVEDGMEPGAAIAAVRHARSGAVETVAQEAWVAAGRPAPLPVADRGRAAARDRAQGALLGLAVGDAVGAAIEFEPKPRFARLDDMQAGGPHRLQRGQWTDDTAMALALADSLIAEAEMDPGDLMRRFLDWYDTGAYSCTGTCFDIGTQTRAALEQYRRSGTPLAGVTAPNASGNGALMRLAPVAIRHWRDHVQMAPVAALQTRTTHGSPATLAASDVFATMLADAIGGASLNDILSGPAAEGIEGGWRGVHRDAIHGSGYVVRSLQAAIWAVSRSTDFRSAVLLAANLGDDADTTAAIAGQLAGAVYGVSGIPAAWLAALAWQERLTDAARQLFDAS